MVAAILDGGGAVGVGAGGVHHTAPQQQECRKDDVHAIGKAAVIPTPNATTPTKSPLCLVRTPTFWEIEITKLENRK